MAKPMQIGSPRN